MASWYTANRDRYVESVADYERYVLPLLRIGLGLVIFLAGAHKLIAPEVWTPYAAPWVLDLWPGTLLNFEQAMMLNGVFEVLFGLALLVGFQTPVVAGLVALSLLAVVVDLVSGAIMAGDYVDILIRDIGLVTLATGVTILAAAHETTS